jgi:cyclophilin family peptidyl-prolyl cis-trans isomerase
VPKPSKPKGKLDPGKKYVVTVDTNCGSFDITLSPKQAPKTDASFVSLVKQGFYDGLSFHRVVPGFVIQGGDPTAGGSGGPGYTTRDRVPPTTQYAFGRVAMAKTQTEPPGTAGSQFFVVTGKDVGLPPEYAVLGRIVSGAAVIRRIGRFGDPTTEQPTRVVEIERAALHVR